MVAVIVPSGDYESEGRILDELDACAEVKSTMGLANIEAMDGYMLTDAVTPRQLETMFANLFSNSLRANPAAKITISCTGRTLEYHDGRIWPEAACAQLAGVQTPEALANGCTGLLLVYRCAQNLGWRLETAANQETVLRMTLPPEPLAAFGTHNVLRTPRPESGAARLREEFRATLPPKKI